MPGIKITFGPRWRDILGRFATAEKALQDGRGEMMKNLGRRWVTLARQEAPKGKTGQFRRGIGYRISMAGKYATLETGSPQPLGRWITGGTKAHAIVPVHASALSFLWAKMGGKRVFFKRVWHPGTKPNPYHKRATKRWRPHAYKELRRIALDFKTRVTR